MLEKFISYFSRRHLLANLLSLGVLMGGVAAWNLIKKEELPDMTFDFVRINTRYPGAAASDVEKLITRPIENSLRTIDDLHLIRSTSSAGLSSVSVELEQGLSNIDEKVLEIRGTVLDADLPQDLDDDPSVRVFKTTKKAILDIGLIRADKHLLDPDSRRKLQSYVRALENQLIRRREINSIERHSYRSEEIRIEVDPRKLHRFNISFDTVMREIRNNHVLQPAGALRDSSESRVTLSAELNDTQSLEKLIIQGGFEGGGIRLSEVAQVVRDFEERTNITKINGREGVFLNVVKGTTTGILEAREAALSVVDQFRGEVLAGSDYEIVLLDDESVDIRNRLKIVTINGIIGFTLILIFLFSFLTFRAGVWVAVGIPFTFSFALICMFLMDYTINNITLAGVIIVMGMVVDDAIIVAEEVTRFFRKGLSWSEAAIRGTASVFLPVTASVVTTCAAFVPFFFIEGRWVRMMTFIPAVIFLMLLGSLLESLLILPSHLGWDLPGRLWDQIHGRESASRGPSGHWFDGVEEAYGRAVRKILPHRWAVYGIFLLLISGAIWILATRMKYEMFPNEETRQITVSAQAPEGTKAIDTATLIIPLEDILRADTAKDVVGFRTEVARSRWGGAVEENRLRMRIEILSRDNRDRSADQMIEDWKTALGKNHGFEKLTFSKGWWGQESDAPIEIRIQANNDEIRRTATTQLLDLLNAHPLLENAETKRTFRDTQYRLGLDRDKLKRLSISPQDVGATLRAALEGRILYEIIDDDEIIKVRITVPRQDKTSIDGILAIPVGNRREYLVPLKNVVSVKKIRSPVTIERREFRRVTIAFSDIVKTAKLTALEAAELIETDIFPKIVRAHPSVIMNFGGAVEETRESGRGLIRAVYMVILMIYALLTLLFGSIIKPLIIMLAIPFGVVGVVFAFWIQGITVFGMFAAMGTIGLAGVVINDSIVMLVKLQRDYRPGTNAKASYQKIADVVKTRLRAVILTTVTTVAAVFPTAYGWAGYDAMLAEMMMAMSWGLLFGTTITLVLVPCLYCSFNPLEMKQTQ